MRSILFPQCPQPFELSSCLFPALLWSDSGLALSWRSTTWPFVLQQNFGPSASQWIDVADTGTLAWMTCGRRSRSGVGIVSEVNPAMECHTVVVLSPRPQRNYLL
jgi:hypothetical protein